MYTTEEADVPITMADDEEVEPMDADDGGDAGAADDGAAGEAGAAGAAGGDKKRFEVKKWNAVSQWAWDIIVENCAICRNHMTDPCTLGSVAAGGGGEGREKRRGGGGNEGERERERAVARESTVFGVWGSLSRHKGNQWPTWPTAGMSVPF